MTTDNRGRGGKVEGSSDKMDSFGQNKWHTQEIHLTNFLSRLTEFDEDKAPALDFSSSSSFFQ